MNHSRVFFFLNMSRTCSEVISGHALFCRLNQTSTQAVQILSGVFCLLSSVENAARSAETYVSCFALMPAFVFSQTLPLSSSSSSCSQVSCVSSALPPPPPVSYIEQVSVQGNGRESLWPGRLITVYSLIRSGGAKLISESGLICHKCLNLSSFSPRDAFNMITLISCVIVVALFIFSLANMRNTRVILIIGGTVCLF